MGEIALQNLFLLISLLHAEPAVTANASYLTE